MIKLREISSLSELMEWRKEVIRHVFAAEPDDALLDANRAYYRKAIEEGNHYALEATVDGAGAGCGAICFGEELPSPDNMSGKCAYLMNIYVREAFRNHGIAHEIVRKLIEVARDRGCGKIYLETTADGRPVYESLGFKDMKDMMKLE